MQQRTVQIQITLGHTCKLECSLGVDVDLSLPGLSEEQQISELLTSLCDAFQLYPRGLYANIWN